MADPRDFSPQNRLKATNHSPLMMALVRKQTGDIINFCPFGCDDTQLDENGFCGHLIGFYNGGATFEPRVKQLDSKGKVTGRIITSGENRQPMKDGYRLVKITTSARVYGPSLVSDLIPKKNNHVKGIQDMMNQERELSEFAEKIRNPVLEGDWDGSIYEPVPVPKVPAGT